MEEVEVRVLNLIAKHFKKSPSEIDLESSFVEGLGGDSIDLVEIIIKLEEEFGLPVMREDLLKLRTPREAIEFFKKKKRG